LSAERGNIVSSELQEKLMIQKRQNNRKPTKFKKVHNTAGGMSVAAKQRNIAKVKHHLLLQKLETIRVKAKVLTETPSYTVAEYTRDVYALAKSEKRSPLDIAEALREAIAGLGSRKASPWLAIVRASSDFDGKEASELATELRKASEKKMSLREFSSSLKLPDRNPPTSPGMGKRRTRK
jgi:hypothetical protein